MSYPSIFSQPVSDAVIQRIEKLTPTAKGQWGKMNVSQMLAHCNVTYEMVYENIHPKPNPFMKFILKALIKRTVVTEKPYKRNSPTASAFLIKETRDFDLEKKRLVAYIQKTLQLGETHFNNKVSISFGKLSTAEWNAMFYKHLDHHLNQFGV